MVYSNNILRRCADAVYVIDQRDSQVKDVIRERVCIIFWNEVMKNYTTFYLMIG